MTPSNRFWSPLRPGRPFRLIASTVLLAASAAAHAAAPSPPGDLRYDIYSPTAAELFWNRASDDVIVVGYELSINGQIIGTLDALSYFTDTLTPGTRYEVVLTAIDNEGNRSTPVATDFVAGDRNSEPTEPTEPTEPVPGTGPAVPTGLRADVYSETAIEVFWDRVQGTVLSYEVSLDGVLYDVKDGTSAFIDTLQRGQTVEVSVVAVNNADQRSPAATVLVTTRGDATPQPPQEPTGDVPTPANAWIAVYSSTAAELFWDRPSPESRVVLTQVLRDGNPIGSTNGTSYFDDQRAPGSRYRYELIAQNADGESSAPAVVDEGGSEPPIPGTSVFSPLASDIVDAVSYYQEDGYDTINVIRADIKTVTTPGVCTVDDYSGCTLADVLADTNGDDDFEPEIKVHFTSDDYPDDGMVSNAELRQRGGTSRLAPQKSFRVKLDNDDALWRNEDRLQLNKHPYDPARIRNKLSFDLMRDLPHLPSLRTQFVNLWIDDGAGPVDQGLFTHVEYVGKEYLLNRDRDKDDNLYKIEYFEFSQADLNNLKVDENGEPLDEDQFEKSLDPKRGDDHRKVVEMIEAVNDPDRSFDAILDKYFNRNNVLMWVTANLLLHQTDAITHNFYLYNPAGTDKFYFMPWDYDGTFYPESVLTNSIDNAELGKRLYYGYARGINSNFVSRYYRLPGIHEKILAAADEIRNTWLTDSIIAQRAQQYYDVVTPYLSRSPDVDYNTFNPNRAAGMAGYVASVHDAMHTTFDIPMPPTQQAVTVRDGDKVVFAWTPAYDVTRSNTFTYELQVSNSVTFSDGSIVFSASDIPDAAERVSYETEASNLPSGPLYYRVIARSTSDPDRVWQVAENYEKIDGTLWYGMMRFELP